MVKLTVVAGLILAMTNVAGVAQTPLLGGTIPPPPPVVPPSNGTTSRGPALVTGAPGAPQTIMIPGSPVPGTVFDNGNGTSSVMVPGGGSQLIPTPR